MKKDSDMFQQANSRLFEFAKKNRSNSTKAEEKLWKELKGKKLHGFKFRRQHPIGHFILDFYCHKAKLAIELDGPYHENEEQKQYDELRTKALNDIEIKELRFKNEEVFNNIERVLETIKEQLMSK